MTSTETTKLPDAFDFYVGPEKLKSSIPAAQLKDAKAIFPLSAKLMQNLGKIADVNELLQTCDADAFASYSRWTAGDNHVFNMDAVPVGEEQDGWVTLTKLMEVAEAMGSSQFALKVIDTMKLFSLSREGNYPAIKTIERAEILIDARNDSNIWVAFAMAWITHHDPAKGLHRQLFYMMGLEDVPSVLMFHLIKQLGKIDGRGTTRETLILEDWIA